MLRPEKTYHHEDTKVTKVTKKTKNIQSGAPSPNW
jgi:hypothetical protein